MPLESATYISDLSTSNPSAADQRKQGDDHIRLVKSTLQNTFPNVTGAVTVTHTQINSVTSKADIASPTFTGTPAVPTATTGTNTTQAASTAFVTAAIAAAGSGLSVTILNKGRIGFYGG